MKKIVLTLLAVATFGTMMAQENINAERRAPRMMTPEQMTERMTQELDLNKDQQAKVMELNKAYQSVVARPGMGRGPRGPRPGGMGRPEGMRRPDGMQKVDEQKAEQKKVEQKVEKKADKKAEQKADAETGATQRPQNAERFAQRPQRPEMSEAQRAEMQKRMERRKEYSEKLKEILTPEQFEKYQQRRQPRPLRR